METLQEKTTEPAENDAPPSEELVFLDPGSFDLRQEGNRLQFRRTGAEEWREVTVARLFPFSEPDRWISLQNKEGKELGVIRELKGIEREKLACLRQELDRRYLVPFIRRIHMVKHLRGIVKMAVNTDRGNRVFYLRNLNECIQQPFAGYLIISDVDGNRYDIPDIQSLDSESRRLLELCI